MIDLILHGTWSAGALFVWGESTNPAPMRKGRQPRVPLHPNAAPPEQLRAALAELAPAGEWADVPVETRVALIPSNGQGPDLPPWFAPEAEKDRSTLHLAPWKVTGLPLPVLDALDLLVALPTGGDDRRLGVDLRYWSLVAKFGLELLARHRYLPGLAAEEGKYRAAWLPVLDDPQDRARRRLLLEGMPPACRALFTGNREPAPVEAATPEALLDDFVRRVIDRAARDWGRAHKDIKIGVPSGAAGAWWNALWSEDGAITLPPSQREQLPSLFEAWKEWTGQLHAAETAAFRLCFRLEPPEVDAKPGQAAANWTLRYMLQANDDPSLLIPAEQVWQARGGELKYLERRFAQPQERLLASLGVAARLFPPIMASLHTARPESASLAADQAYAFLREVGPLLEGSGFGVLVPPWWNKPGARLGLRAKLNTAEAAPAPAGQGILGMDTLVHFDWELAIGDEPLSREEFERLAALKSPLVQVRGQWVMLQPEQVEAAIAFWEKKRRQKELSLGEAIEMALGGVPEVAGLPVQGVETTGWLSELMAQLRLGERLQELPQPEGFVGQLRPYQVRGYSWLEFLGRWGLGACLADDMGTGKTVAAISMLLHEREQSSVPPALLLCPTSVVGNWEREVHRFAPSLRVLVHHGSTRASGEDLLAAVKEADLVVSTYGLVRRDVDDLAKVRWSAVILDEAQNVKNPQAKQTQAVRRLKAPRRIALTGTPVENRLSELWSIMNLLNPGLLGSQASFRKEFALPIERYGDEDVTRRLKSMVSPFILRRLKTDPNIIQDLPEKLEMKVYCSLTPEQATLYQAVVQESLRQIEEADGMKRRGVVLSTLLRLKQVCNHPAHLLGDGSALPGRSGKLDRLAEMLEEVLSVGDRALIFTQFAEMGHMLHAYLQEQFRTEVLFLHGGTPQKQRDRMVDRFQQPGGGPPILLLSLRAGGTGLNLTAANHVFHFDRWWNPAVENQATDRAFRIGQTRNVQVHKLICAGTLEERIDELIESKKALAESIVGGGEEWLTELSTDELRKLIVLGEG